MPGPATSTMRVMDQVPISQLRTHRGNPRRGNTDMIAESLRVNGQYRPILVHRGSMTVIAGNHTYRAARQLGWREIAVHWFEGTPEQAEQIMLADNRASDAGYTDETAAFSILATLPSLEGTGYTPEDLQLPDLDLDWPAPEPVEPGEREDQERAPAAPTKPFRIGDAVGAVEATEYAAWRRTLPRAPGEAEDTVLLRLGLLEEMSTAPARQAITGTGQARIRELELYPGNPRQGDIGLLTQLLKTHGQTRPVTVNRRNNRILTGNHVTEAARQLGWESIGVTWVDVDDDGEKRILLADNRTADLAGYDLAELGQAIGRVGAAGIHGTGFTLADLDDVIAGKAPKEHARSAGAIIQIGAIKTRVRAGLIRDAGFTPGQELVEAAAMLKIDPKALQTTQT